MSIQPPPASTASAVGPCPTVIQIVGRPGTGSLPSTIALPYHPQLLSELNKPLQYTSKWYGQSWCKKIKSFHCIRSSVYTNELMCLGSRLTNFVILHSKNYVCLGSMFYICPSISSYSVKCLEIGDHNLDSRLYRFLKLADCIII